MQNITKRFGDNAVLHGISFHVLPGEFVSIVGKSGAGKTTLIKLLLGIERPTEGDILIDEKPLTKLSAAQLQEHRSATGTIFQDSKLFPQRSVFENVSFALEALGMHPHEALPRVSETLERLNLTHLQDRYPHQLSGGEMHQVALARAIVHRPRLLLADEPTANLDRESAREIIKELLKLNMEGTTAIFTTHNRDLVTLGRQKIVEI